MKNVLVAAVIMVSFAASAFAADPTPPAAKAPEQKDAQATSPEQKFDQRKERIIKYLDKQITRGQEAKACYEAAKNLDDLKACKAKFERKGHKKHHKRDRMDKQQQDQAQQPAAQPQK